MRDESAFEHAEFLGLARREKRDSLRLAFFARHLEPDEVPLAVLPILGATLVVTDRRLLELRTHLEIDGAWNVREFTGYAVAREVLLEFIRGVSFRTGLSGSSGAGIVEDSLRIVGPEGAQEFILSRGPGRVLPDEDVSLLVDLLTRRSRFRN